MPLPQLTEEQRRDALAKAAEARRRRAQVKAQLKNGGLGLSECLERSENDEILGKMKVSAMLEALPGVGKVRAQKVMEELNISPSRRLRGLGDKQKSALRDRFGRR
ncbi:MAG: integration host factor, actinobacterial type [Actinomycetota bacterium]